MVKMETEIDRDGVLYIVWQEEREGAVLAGYEIGDGWREVWRAHVLFGKKNTAGSEPFQKAARKQEQIAWELAYEEGLGE